MTTTDSPLQHQAQDAEGLRAIEQKLRKLIGGNPTCEDAEADAQWLLLGLVEVRSMVCDALSASPPQAETPGLDREAVARIIADDRPLAEQAKHHGRDWAVWWQGSGERGDHIMEVAQSGLGYARELTFLGTDHHDQAGTLVAEHNEQVRRLREVIARQAAAKALLQKEVAHLQSEAEFNRHNAGPSPWPEPWKRCPSTHCERSEECRSPHDCTVRSAPATGEHSADAILAATAVSRPPTTCHGAEDVEALRPIIAIIEKTVSLAEANGLDEVVISGTISHWNLVNKILVEQIAPAQPGPAPVGKGDAIEALKPFADKATQTEAGLGSTTIPDTYLVYVFLGDLRRARAALDSIPAAGGTEIPEGWRLVPVEPTDEMEEAACWAADNGNFSGQYLLGIYRAMLAAAPLPAAPTQTAREGGEA